MNILCKVLVSIPILGFLIALWAIGMKAILADIAVGRLPGYEMATTFGVPEWLPLTSSFIIMSLFCGIIFHKYRLG